MSFDAIAGLPVQTGLYVALVPMLVYALLGMSRPLSMSSTTTPAILTATGSAMAVPGGDPARLMAAASGLALLTGVFLILAGTLRLGFLANFLSLLRVRRTEFWWALAACAGVVLLGTLQVRDNIVPASLNPEALKVVESSPLGQTLGKERMFINLREAVKAYEKREKG